MSSSHVIGVAKLLLHCCRAFRLPVLLMKELDINPVEVILLIFEIFLVPSKTSALFAAAIPEVTPIIGVKSAKVPLIVRDEHDTLLKKASEPIRTYRRSADANVNVSVSDANRAGLNLSLRGNCGNEDIFCLHVYTNTEKKDEHDQFLFTDQKREDNQS